MDTIKLQALEARTHQLDREIAKSQGALGAVQDLIRALIQTHPDVGAVRAALPQDLRFPTPLHQQGYQGWMEAALRRKSC